MRFKRAGNILRVGHDYMERPLSLENDERDGRKYSNAVKSPRSAPCQKETMLRRLA